MLKLGAKEGPNGSSCEVGKRRFIIPRCLLELNRSGDNGISISVHEFLTRSSPHLSAPEAEFVERVLDGDILLLFWA